MLLQSGRSCRCVFVSHHCQLHFHPSPFPSPAPCSDSPPAHLLHTQTIPCHHTVTSSWWNSHLMSHGRNFWLWQSLQCHRRGLQMAFFPLRPTAFIKTNVFPPLFLHNLDPGIANPGRRVGFVSPLQSWVIPQGISGLFLGNSADLGTLMENSPCGALQSRAALGPAGSACSKGDLGWALPVPKGNFPP